MTDHSSRWRQTWDDSSHHIGYLIPLGTSRSAVVAAQAVQAELALPFVDSVPPESPDVTVHEAGFAEELALEKREELVSEAWRALRGVEPSLFAS
ncbi:MAG TPA: hypothetical protein VIT93_02735 [Dehalococcoidia bacterium]